MAGSSHGNVRLPVPKVTQEGRLASFLLGFCDAQAGKVGQGGGKEAAKASGALAALERFVGGEAETLAYGDGVDDYSYQRGAAFFFMAADAAARSITRKDGTLLVPLSGTAQTYWFGGTVTMGDAAAVAVEAAADDYVETDGSGGILGDLIQMAGNALRGGS